MGYSGINLGLNMMQWN